MRTGGHLARVKLSVVLAMVCALSFVPAASAGATAPLVGTMDLQFNLCWPGPQVVTPEWVGTITFGDEQYGMAFLNIGNGKPFEGQPSGSVLFYGEIWTIYADLDYAFGADGCLTTFEPGEVLLSGNDRGVLALANSGYHMTGSVEEAYGDFSMWLGRPVYMSGIIVWYPSGAPQFAPGTLRLH